ncbi:MAG: CHAT domain-containing protein [Aureispira sp.]
MKLRLQSPFLLYLFSLLSTPLLAFQQLPPALEKYGSLEKAVSATEELAYAGEFSRAIELGEKVKEVYRQQKDKERLCFINQELLLFEVLREDLDPIQKEEEIKVFCEYSKEKKDPNIDQICQSALAHLMVYSGQIDRFEVHYKEATLLAKQQSDYKTLRNLNVNIATEYLFLSEWKKAQSYLEKAESALAKEKKTPTDTELGSFHNARSVIYYNLSDYDKALSSALFNINLLERSEEDQTVALLYDYNNLAGIYTGLGENENASIYYQKALDILPNTDDYPVIEEAILYYNTSIAYQKIGNHDQTKHYISKTLSTLSLIEDRNNNDIIQTEIYCYYMLITLSHAKNQIDSCNYYANKVKQLLKFAPTLLSDYYRHKSEIELLKGNHNQAIQHAINSANQAHQDYGENDTRLVHAYTSLSDIYKEINNYQEVVINCQKALEAASIDFKYQELYKNPSINNILHKKLALKTLVSKIVGLRGLYKQNKSPEIAQAIFNTTRFSTKVLEQSSKEFKNPTTKRKWLQEQAIPLFETAIASAIDIAKSTGDQQYLQEAFELSERSKSMLMIDMLQEQQAAAAGGVPDSLVNELQRLKRALHVAKKKRFDAIAAQEMAAQKEAENRVFQINQNLDILKRRFEKEYPKYYSLKYDEKQVSLEEIQASLKAGSMLLEFFEGDNDIYVFSVYNDRLEVASFKRDKTYKRLFKRFSNALIDVRDFVVHPVKVYNAFVIDAHKLYQYLIAPVDLEGIQRIIIIPDGELSYLPFEVLLSDTVQLIGKEEEVIKANFSKLPYLLHDFSTNYNYSGRLWLERNALSKKAVNNRILALAPKYSGVELPDWRGQREVDLRKKLADLPGAFDEVQHLKEHYAGKFYSGYEANEALLKKEAPNYGILHLAMHGLVNSKKPEFSGLALAEDKSKNEDNFLYAYEIEQLPIHASLIVLSACETGIGQYQRGEGVVSIGRSFVYAGAPSLLMTLWNLNDQSGAFIIEAFYKNLNAGLEKDEAIRQAKLHYLKTYPQEYAHPFLWAPFVQVGSYESISIASKSNNWWIYALLSTIGILTALVIFYISRRKTR